MKKILAITAVSAVLSTGAIAGELYGSVGAAMTTLSYWDSGVSLVATAGMKLDNVTPNFAVEVEMSQTVVDPSAPGISSWDLSIFGLGAYAVYNFNIPDTSITVKPRLGLNYESWSVDGAWAGSEVGTTSLSYGVGANYPLSSGLSVYADFTDKGSSNNIGAGVQMNF
jgi:predicted porin